jgi:hypothetical protein
MHTTGSSGSQRIASIDWMRGWLMVERVDVLPFHQLGEFKGKN